MKTGTALVSILFSATLFAMPTAPLRVQLTADGKLPWDPTTTGFAHITFYNAVLGRLLRLDANLTVVPGILEQAYWDFAKSHYVVKLRPNVRFHTGRTATAEDLDFSLVRFFLSKRRVDPIAFLRHVDGADALKPGTPYRPFMVRGIKKLDALTIAVKLTAPNPAFLYSLSEGWVSLVPREALEDDYVTWKKYPVGAGPYRVVSVEGSRVLLERVDGNAAAPFGLAFQSAAGAPADVVGFVPVDETKTTLKKVYGSGPIGFTGLFFNRNNALARDGHFRRAVALAVEREALVQGNSDYTPLAEMLTSNFYGRLGATETRDLARAKAELAHVPAALRREPVRLATFSGRTDPTPADRKVLEALKFQLETLGLSVSFRSSSHPTFAESDTETVLRIDDRGTAFPDPLVIFRAFEKPAFLSPFFLGPTAEFGRLLKEAARAGSLDVKAQSIHALSSLFHEHTVVIPLYERKTVYWINPAVVSQLGVQTGITFDVNRIVLAGGSQGAQKQESTR